MAKTYTVEEFEELMGIQEQMSALAARVAAITAGDGHTEAYFTEPLCHLINGDPNRYNQDFIKVLNTIEESVYDTDWTKAYQDTEKEDCANEL
jgi:coenzyme F420-reducing hydrogenase alpha subunit